MRGKKRWRRKILLPKREMEELEIARANAVADIQQGRDRETRLGASRAIQRAIEADRHECMAWITNIPFSITALKLRDFLQLVVMNHEHIAGCILECEILKQRKGRFRGRSSGKAAVRFATRPAFHHVLNHAQTQGLVLEERKLNITEGHRPKRIRDATVKPFSRVQLQVGRMVAYSSEAGKQGKQGKNKPSSVLDVQYEPQLKMSLEWNGREKRALAMILTLDSGTPYRLEFDLQNLIWLKIGLDEHGQRVVLLHFQLPPHIFRSQEENTGIHDDAFASLIAEMLQLDEDRFFWSNTSESIESSSDRWTRTVDPSAGSNFSRRATYRLVFDHTVPSSEDSRLLDTFREFSLKSKPDQSIFSVKKPGAASTMANDPTLHWCRGFYQEFKQLNFHLRYLLHAILVNTKLQYRLELLPDAVVAAKLGQTLAQMPPGVAEWVLERYLGGITFYNSTTELINELEQEAEYEAEYCEAEYIQHHNNKSEADDKSGEDESDDETFYESEEEEPDQLPIQVYRVLVTPTRTCPQIPAVERSNRILRQFQHVSDRFVRVVFVDESFGSLFEAMSTDIAKLRLMPICKANGLCIAGEQFYFLAYSNSQLREQSCWFYNEKGHGSNDIPSADEIRRFIGDLSAITNIGKFNARLGQGFSTSITTSELLPEQVKILPQDIIAHGYCFSDGVGTISSRLAHDILTPVVREQLGLDSKYIPSAFQIRMGGAKGVVSVFDNPSIECSDDDRVLVLRPSMVKFSSLDRHLEICQIARSFQCHLNRQTITILSGLGIPDDVFETLWNNMLTPVAKSLTSQDAALQLVRNHLPFHHVVRQMLDAGFNIESDKTRKVDRHLYGQLCATVEKLLLDLLYRARVRVPQGVTLMGILDETQTLAYGEIYIPFSDPVTLEDIDLPTGTLVAVTRCPCLHPGDVRVLSVVARSDVSSALSELHNVIVFPATGPRPHPDEMSGGDLDGDLYTVLYDPRLVPDQVVPAMATPSMASRDPVLQRAQHHVTPEEMATFFVHYLQNDNLGRIASAHCVAADVLDDGVHSDVCLQLAQLHSVAVDFAKTGIPAEFPSNLVQRTYPDFMQNSTKPSYESKKVMGRMFRQTRALYAQISAEEDEVDSGLDSEIDSALVLPGSHCYMEEAEVLLCQYNHELFRLLRRYGIEETEQEAMSGYVIHFSRTVSRQRSNHYHAQERLNQELETLQKSFQERFWEDLLPEFKITPPQDREEVLHQNDKVPIVYEVMKKVSAWYQVAYGAPCSKSSGPRLLSFPWSVPSAMCRLKIYSLQTRQSEADNFRAKSAAPVSTTEPS